MRCFSIWFWNLFPKRFTKWHVTIANPNRLFLSALSNYICINSFGVWPTFTRWESVTGTSNHKICCLIPSLACLSFVISEVPSTWSRASLMFLIFVHVIIGHLSSFSEPPTTPRILVILFNSLHSLSCLNFLQSH